MRDCVLCRGYVFEGDLGPGAGVVVCETHLRAPDCLEQIRLLPVLIEAKNA